MDTDGFKKYLKDRGVKGKMLASNVAFIEEIGNMLEKQGKSIDDLTKKDVRWLVDILIRRKKKEILDNI